MFWIIALVVGVVLLVRVSDKERATGESNTFARYSSLALIGYSVGALLASVI